MISREIATMKQKFWKDLEGTSLLIDYFNCQQTLLDECSEIKLPLMEREAIIDAESHVNLLPHYKKNILK